MLFMAFLVLLTPLQWFACNGHGIRSLMVRVRHVRLRPLLLALAVRLRLMFLVLALRRCLHGQPRRYRRISQAEVTIAIRRNRPKPAWVKLEVLRLAALTGKGCRSIEKLFNRIYATSRKMTVSKSYVHYTIRKHRYEIEVLRRDIRRRPPRPVPRNYVWPWI